MTIRKSRKQQKIVLNPKPPTRWLWVHENLDGGSITAKRKRDDEDDAFDGPLKLPIVHVKARRQEILEKVEKYTPGMVTEAMLVRSLGRLDQATGKFICICGQDLRCKAGSRDWYRHLQTMQHWKGGSPSQERPERWTLIFLCELCGTSTSRCDALIRHEVTQHGARYFGVEELEAPEPVSPDTTTSPSIDTREASPDIVFMGYSPAAAAKFAMPSPPACVVPSPLDTMPFSPVTFSGPYYGPTSGYYYMPPPYSAYLPHIVSRTPSHITAPTEPSPLTTVKYLSPVPLLPLGTPPLDVKVTGRFKHAESTTVSFGSWFCPPPAMHIVSSEGVVDHANLPVDSPSRDFPSSPMPDVTGVPPVSASSDASRGHATSVVDSSLHERIPPQEELVDVDILHLIVNASTMDQDQVTVWDFIEQYVDLPSTP